MSGSTVRIRFPVKNLNEFTLVAEDKILTAEETHAVFQYLEEGRDGNEKNKLPFNIVAHSNYTIFPYANRREVELCDPQELDLAGNMKDLFDSVTPSTILLNVRAIGLFLRCDLASCLGLCTHLTIKFFSSGLCLDS